MLNSLTSLGALIVGLLAFATKEASEVIRQPRLILSLLLGPTLILVLFGVGYQTNRPTVNTLLVVPANPPQGYDVNAITQVVSSTFHLVGVTHDRDAALQALADKQVELVEIWPDNFDQYTQQGQRIPVEFYTNEINPFTEAWIQYLGYGQITQINNLVLVQAATQSQGQVTEAKAFLSDARAQVQAMRGGVTTASQPGQIEQLQAGAQALSISAQLDPNVSPATKADLAGLVSDLAALRTARDQGKLSEQKDRLDQTDQRLARLEAVAATLKSIPPDVLVQPLVQDYKNTAPIHLDPMAFYAPAVLALLLQHIAVTLGALSVVRERAMGSLELFRVAPVSAFQMLAGKYLGYLAFLGVIIAALTALLVYGLGVPFQGDVRLFALEIFLLTLASLGIGFTLSAISSTDSQAVQFSMLMLLASIFFTGFFLSLDSFRMVVQYLANILPLTHGILVLQDEMLLGRVFHPYSILALAVIAGVTFMTALYFTQRQFKRV